MDSEPESPTPPQSYAFTVHFDNGKPSAEKPPRRHIRNLSLPISKVYEAKEKSETESRPVNGRLVRRAGNHSEGYFSSDDDSKPKLFEVKHKYSEFKGGIKCTNAAQEKRSVLQEPEKRSAAQCEPVKEPASVQDTEEEGSSDVASEAGTYTIDKDSPEVETARKSIDQVFAVQLENETKTNQQVNTTTSSGSTWVNEWASSVLEFNHHTSLDSNQSSSSSRASGVSNSGSKIPSPINLRSRQPPATQPLRVEHLDAARNRKSYPVSAQDVETESYLRTTERVMSALQARVSLSLDSGGESDAENSLGPAHATNGETTVRYNRALSLRRGRLEEPKKKVSTPITPAPVPLLKPKSCELAKPTLARTSKRDSAPPSLFNRTDCGRFSMRTPSSRPLPQSPLMSTAKKEVVKKKSSSGGSARSNSTLSSKEVEFQNWKRRKSYDPMKAAAEGKKKDAAKKPSPSVMTQSINSTLTTPKSPVNPVLRSASFHGTRQLVASSSEEDEEVVLSAEDEDWPGIPAPQTSLENSPRGSKVSLYSNTNSNSPTPPLRHRAKLEGVDTLVISALAGLSTKLKGSSCNLLNKLRFLYDEDSPKNHRLGAMIDQLEAADPSSGSPQHKSPSRELASTLRNLKRLESMLKVLDDVLFDEEEFQ